jgi:hypothetical protein
MTDVSLLEPCRLRLAQLLEVRAELAGAEGGLLAELEQWSASDELAPREKAALSFAEQYHYDHRRLSQEQKDELAHHLPSGGTTGFVWALHMNDAYLRVLSLLEVAPDSPSAPARSERLRPDAPVLDPARVSELPPVHRELARVVVRQSLVDDFTSEVVRLHNADHQGCRY